jgi:SNF family Na+-dependent transporter
MVELYVGQKLQVSAIKAWPQYHRAFGGMGIAGVLCTFFVALYYNVVVAWGACGPLPTSSSHIISTPHLHAFVALYYTIVVVWGAA